LHSQFVDLKVIVEENQMNLQAQEEKQSELQASLDSLKAIVDRNQTEGKE
jgi:hypothetical protein